MRMSAPPSPSIVSAPALPVMVLFPVEPRIDIAAATPLAFRLVKPSTLVPPDVA